MHLAFTKLSVNGFLGGLFMMSLSDSSYASEIAGTCLHSKIKYYVPSYASLVMVKNYNKIKSIYN